MTDVGRVRPVQETAASGLGVNVPEASPLHIVGGHGVQGDPATGDLLPCETPAGVTSQAETSPASAYEGEQGFRSGNAAAGSAHLPDSQPCSLYSRLRRWRRRSSLVERIRPYTHF